MYRNLLDETIIKLSMYNLTLNDISFIRNGETMLSIEDFKKYANSEYDAGYGCNKIRLDLLIVGENWWLERHEYDGSEWWEYKTMPQEIENWNNIQKEDIFDMD